MEKKNNLNIKPIDLKIVPTALEKSKKVMVSCEINGKITHYYIFIDKKEGYKDEDYIKEAKKQLDDDIKNGVIKKKIATTTFKHPFVLATLGVVGAIALTMTGLFAWKAITAGGGGTPEPQPEPVPPEPTPTDDGDPTKPLTFVSLDDNGGVYFQYVRDEDASAPIPDREEISLEYQIDDEETWHAVEGVHQSNDDYVIPIAEGLKKGQEVRLRGDNPYWTYIDSDDWNSGEELSLITNGVFSVENNIMSLLHKENFVGATDLRCGEFIDLFSKYSVLSSKYDNCIYDASKLILPKVEELPAYCYEMMFYKNTALTFAPKEIIFKKGGCSACGKMFNLCEGLIVGPKQIGDIDCELGEYCCSEVFTGCKKMKYGPYLPAISLGDSCYSWMFNGCDSLIELKVGFEATAWQGNSFSNYWFSSAGSIPLSVGLTPKFYLKGEQEPSARNDSYIPEEWEIVHY